MFKTSKRGKKMIGVMKNKTKNNMQTEVSILVISVKALGISNKQIND